MFKKLFKKEFTNNNFFLELLSETPKESWLVEALKSGEINIDEKVDSENTCLMICLKKGKFKSALWLIDNGADPTIQDKDHKTAIDIAIQKDKISVVEELLKVKKTRYRPKR